VDVQQGRCAHKGGRSRAEGKSSTAAAAYRAGVCIVDERTGEIFDFSRKGGVESSEIIVPEGAHDDFKRMAEQSRSGSEQERADAQAAFWNANEKAHKRGDSIVSREIELDFPQELSADDRQQLVREFAQAFADKFKCGIQVSIHEPRTVTDRDLEKNPDQFHVTDPETGRRHNGNWHAHLLLTTKAVDERGFGNKIKELDPKERQFKPTLENPAEWDRPLWQRMVQNKLDERGIDKFYSTGSKEETRKQLIERGEYDSAAKLGEATKHLGHGASAQERRGEKTELGDLNREIKERNREREKDADLASGVLDRLTQKQSTFTDRDLYRELCKQSDDRLGDKLHTLVEQCIARDDVVKLGVDAKGNVRLTTREMQDLERRMVDQAKSRRDEGRHGVNHERLNHHAKKNGLSDEQAAALRHMSGRDGVSLVEGMAGTGKSTMMKAAHEAWREAGYEVRGAALAGKAADGLEQGSGIKSQTVHSLLLQLDSGRQKLTPKTILCVDEAGMLSSRLTARLVDHASKAGAKLVMVGDDRQLQPIDAGGAFKAIKDELGAGKLSTIYRQKDEWARESVHKFADGDAGKAIKAYAERGLVGVGTDADDTKRQLVADWNSQRTDDGRSSIMLAGTRKDVKDLNELARTERVKGGEIEQGERVKTDQGEREFATGDRIVFLKNDKSIGVKNGQLGTVEKIEREGGDGYRMAVRGDDGKLVTLNTKDYDRLDHGYATTVHKAQGVTVDRAYVLSGRMHDRELSYVSMSRSRQETRLYIDASKYKDAASLARQMNQSHQKGTTLDRVEKEPHDWSSMRGIAGSKGSERKPERTDWSHLREVAGSKGSRREAEPTDKTIADAIEGYAAATGQKSLRERFGHLVKAEPRPETEKRREAPQLPPETPLQPQKQTLAERLRAAREQPKQEAETGLIQANRTGQTSTVKKEQEMERQQIPGMLPDQLVKGEGAALRRLEQSAQERQQQQPKPEPQRAEQGEQQQQQNRLAQLAAEREQRRMEREREKQERDRSGPDLSM